MGMCTLIRCYQGSKCVLVWLPAGSLVTCLRIRDTTPPAAIFSGDYGVYRPRETGSVIPSTLML
jgi:hypothetical protein